MGGRMVRVDEALYERLKDYEKESGVPIVRSANEAIRSFVECVVPPRIEFIRSQRPQRSQHKYQIETLADSA